MQIRCFESTCRCRFSCATMIVSVRNFVPRIRHRIHSNRPDWTCSTATGVMEIQFSEQYRSLWHFLAYFIDQLEKRSSSLDGLFSMFRAISWSFAKARSAKACKSRANFRAISRQCAAVYIRCALGNWITSWKVAFKANKSDVSKPFQH